MAESVIGGGSGYLLNSVKDPEDGVTFAVHILNGVGTDLINFGSDGTAEGTKQYAGFATSDGGTAAAPTWASQGSYRPTMHAAGVPATSTSTYANKTLTATVKGADGTILFEGAAAMLTGSVVVEGASA